MECTYRTRQLPQAAFLVAHGYKFLRCEPTIGKFVHLIFEDADGSVARFADSYWDGALCSALAFYRAMTELRKAIAATNGTQGVRRG